MGRVGLISCQAFGGLGESEGVNGDWGQERMEMCTGLGTGLCLCKSPFVGKGWCSWELGRDQRDANSVHFHRILAPEGTFCGRPRVESLDGKRPGI
jgi:hypothetical protein